MQPYWRYAIFVACYFCCMYLSPSPKATCTASSVVSLLLFSSKFTAQDDVLRFQLFQFRKQNGPSYISEGQESVYTVLMDGPRDDDVTLELATAVDGYIRCIIYSSIIFINHIAYLLEH